MAVLVARLLDPALPAAVIEDRLRVLTGQCSESGSPWEALAGLGFTGNASDYESLDNSNLARVLITRRGIPITLAMVLLHVARGLGCHADGVNFPGHFLASVDGVLVDPFIMQPVNQQNLVERLPHHARGLPHQQLFAAASPLAVGMRMLNNVKLAYARSAAWDASLDVIDAQLALAPEQASLHLERGELWYRLGSMAAARTAFEDALRGARTSGSDEGQHVAETARARLQELRGFQDTVH